MTDNPIAGSAIELAILDTLRRIERTQGRILAKLAGISEQEEIAMTLQQDLLDAVTAESSAVDSVIAFINGLVANNTISTEAADTILSTLRADREKLEAAITANVGG